MTTRDETVWDRDARAVLSAMTHGRQTVQIDADLNPKMGGFAMVAASAADALAAERAKRGGADMSPEQLRQVSKLSSMVQGGLRELLDVRDGEALYDAAQRVIRERDEARAEVDDMRHNTIASREWEAMRADRNHWQALAQSRLDALQEIRDVCGDQGEAATEAARRVVRERDAAREVAATLTAERDEARAALRDAKAALDRILDEDALDDIAHDSTADVSIAAQVRDALATVNRALAAKVSP